MGQQTTYNGQTYYVNLLLPVNQGDPTEIYLSLNDNQCTDGDKAITINTSLGTVGDYNNLQTNCKAVAYTNAARTVAGCLSLTSAVICGALAIPTEGLSLLFCTYAWEYAETTGAGDCIKGTIGYISDQLGTNLYWKSLAIAMAISDDNMSDLFGGFMDAYCDPGINPIFQPPPLLEEFN